MPDKTTTPCRICGTRPAVNQLLDPVCLDCFVGTDPEPIHHPDLPRIYDMTTGRALPGHPGLA